MSSAIAILVVATAAFAVAMLSTPAVTRLLKYLKLGKQIRDEASAPIMAKLHAGKSGTPTMGGILIWGSVLAVAFLFSLAANVVRGQPWIELNFISRRETLLPIAVLFFAAIVGLIDDYLNVRKIGAHGGGLKVWHRLLSYSLIAAAAAWWFYVKLEWDVLRVPFVGIVEVGPWMIPIFIFIIVATAFSVNETDGLDGLAGGTLLTAFAAYGGIAFFQGKTELAAFCGAVVGALLAFLWFNINPARFFMGDTGAMSLGVTLGVVAMLTNSLLLLPIIGLVFVLESLSVIIQVLSKMFRKKKVFLSAPIHHHFEAKGWSEPPIVMRFWVIAAVSGVLGLIIALLDR
ncbi:MAG TPA: phospho-N-acetylmuramoyl-pentapeptide-transferase [Candidatus Baltobacteraceae bacterium]|nr:phospho-N-acetylmuramoyl-pentapeptide-transferase [Candidatus Baltobacteraceae bacterium]